MHIYNKLILKYYLFNTLGDIYSNLFTKFNSIEYIQ